MSSQPWGMAACAEAMVQHSTARVLIDMAWPVD
jgi:hypothetical protein